MSLVIRCRWMPRADASLEARIAEAGSLLADPALTSIAGSHWYRLGRSKAAALSRPIGVDELTHIGNWRRVQLPPDRAVYAVDVWNGRVHPEGANVAIAINVPPAEMDTFVLSGLSADYLRSAGVSWSAVLSCAELLAKQLGGVAIVSSHELLDYAQARMSDGARHAAYAAFWGDHRSGRNALIACDSWEDVPDPDDARLRAIIEALSESGRA